MHDPEFEYSGTELDSMVHASNYYRMILDRFAPYLGRRIVEVGAGIGTFSTHLVEASGRGEVTLIEPDRANAERLRERFRGAAGVRVHHGTLDSAGEAAGADSIVLVNVLEHIEDDRALLHAAWKRLAPGGYLLLFLPALPALFGTLDEAFGHFRRYTRAELREKLRAAGFTIELLRYTNFVGVLSWFVAGRVLRKRTLSPGDVRLYDRWVVPWMSRVERVWSPPGGQNLIAVARKGAS
jgi:SAM-dependent methyltransferase